MKQLIFKGIIHEWIEKLTKTIAKVLVVSGESGKHQVYERILSSLDLEIVKAMSGQEAMNVVQEQDFFLILMDVQLPEMDGFETASLLLDHPKNNHIPIVFITSCVGDDVSELKAYAFGAVDYLEEPINDEIVKGKVGVFLKLYQQKLTLVQSYETGINSEEELLARKEQLENIIEKQEVELQSSIDNFTTAETNLVESDKMASLGRLVAGVSHDLNTSVGICVTGASYMQEIMSELIFCYKNGKLRKQDLDKFIHTAPQSTEIVLTNLERASDLISSFKLVAVDVACDMNREFNLYEYIVNVMQSLHSETKRGSHEVFVEGDTLINIDNNPGAISQIITNLVLNSVIHAFTENESGRIIITVTKEKDCIRMLYTDDGKGMDEEQLKRVFEPFYTTRRGSGGSGLGMYMVYNLVTNKLKGEVKCSSEIGKGIKVDICFPV
ncbi:MAG: hybrid sensor histidine kinase/response regulator [Alteromonadaceae bacterium]|nr:hybrid sensor histidine kinase/response regulator [Alteromonadaceae bacterium]